MRLSHGVYDRVLRILPLLYACGTTREFITRVVRLLPSVIEADGYGWFVHSFGPRPGLVEFVESSPRIITPVMVPRIGEAAQSHPFALHWANAKSISALKFSDFPLRDRQRFLDENWDIHREMGTEHMNIPVTVSSTHIHSVGVRRDRKPFRHEDLLVMNLLAPHVRQAHANAQVFERATAGPAPSSMSLGSELSSRESEVGLWVAEGKTNREIGIILGISGRTVEKHVEHLLRKLGIENRATAAVRMASSMRPQQEGTNT